MKKILLALGVIVYALTGFSQNSTDTTYYKEDLSITTIESEAKYLEVKTVISDLVTTSYYSLQPHYLISKEEFNLEGNIGFRTLYNSIGKITSEIKYSDGSDCRALMGENSFAIKYPDKFSESFLKHIHKNIKYPINAALYKIEGTVVLNLKINKEGKIEVLSVLKGVHPSLDMEAVNVASSFQNNLPATLNGEPVETCLSFPFKFKIESNLKSVSEKTDTSYYKDLFCYIPINKKKADFKKISKTLEDGSVHSLISYKNDNKILAKEVFDSTGKKGFKQYFDEKGEIYRQLFYSNNEEDCSVLQDTNSVVIPSEFPEQLYEAIYHRIKLPKFLMENNIYGTVYLSFILTKEGKVEIVSITQGVHPLLDYEVCRVFAGLPKFKPIIRDGYPIDFCFNIPVKFSLQ